MALKHNTWFLVGGLLCGLLFTALLMVRTGIVSRPGKSALVVESPTAVALGGSERWMNILQGDRKIGISHSRLEPVTDGYHLSEQVTMRINTMGLVQDLALNSQGWLNPDLTLQRFTFSMHSGLFTFEAQGKVENAHLVCRIRAGENERRIALPLEAPAYLPAGIFPSLVGRGLAPGARRVFSIFDPSTLSQQEIVLTMQGRETIPFDNNDTEAWKVTLAFKGVSQEVWLDENGQVLMEKGLMGIRQVRVSREEALSGSPVSASEDLTRVAAVVPDRTLPDPTRLIRLTLALDGIDPARYALNGGRQSLALDRLTVSRESLADLPDQLRLDAMPPEAVALLAPSSFVQSDHPKIKALAARVVVPDDTPLNNLRRLVDWIQRNIQKRPVLSVPDALNTLDQGMGDCNEHAVLLAALARAAGFPAQVEAGLVYHEGRFLYHAWNRVYIDRWITVDALFDQIPADVTHVRFAQGTTQEQLDILSLLGNLRIKVVELERSYQKPSINELTSVADDGQR
jgi:hypothetical protein